MLVNPLLLFRFAQFGTSLGTLQSLTPPEEEQLQMEHWVTSSQFQTSLHLADGSAVRGEQEAEVVNAGKQNKKGGRGEKPHTEERGEEAAASFPHPLGRRPPGVGRQSPVWAGASAGGP